jgi:hypothetical protein
VGENQSKEGPDSTKGLILNDIYCGIMTLCHSVEVKNTSINIRVIPDGFPYQKSEKVSLFRLLLSKQLAQNSQCDVAGTGARELVGATCRKGDKMVRGLACQCYGRYVA